MVLIILNGNSNNIKTGKIKLEEAKKLQEDFSESLKGIRKGKKSAEQKKVLSNINMLFNGRNDSLKFVEDYGSMILEAKRKAKYGEGLKILTPKQMFQILPIALAQLKAGKNSDSLLNEVKQIIYLLKKVCNNIINSRHI